PTPLSNLFPYTTLFRSLIYVACGEGSIAVIRQTDADHYEMLEKVPTIKDARTCYFEPESGRLYLAVPRQPGKQGPEIWVYQARPDRKSTRLNSSHGSIS